MANQRLSVLKVKIEDVHGNLVQEVTVRTEDVTTTNNAWRATRDELIEKVCMAACEAGADVPERFLS